MMNHDQLQAAIQAPVDQIAAAIREHEKDCHGGGPCFQVREGAVVMLSQAIQPRLVICRPELSVEAEEVPDEDS